MNNSGLVYTVSDLIAIINQTFYYAYPVVEVVGEVSSFKVNQGKFVFFDVKDQTGVINCFMTVWQLRVPIEDGMKVVIQATPKLTDKGKFSLTVKSVKLTGEGSIKKGFEILKAKLEAEGLFEESRKRSLPPILSNLAVISSAQAAGYADFMDILSSRWGGLKISVAQVQVQGDSAADQIIKAINYFNQLPELPEVIAIIRGGGSADDLAVFNDEMLVRAIAASRVPIIVGVGHETDTSLSDFAADVSAITPSNAAQILVPEKTDFVKLNNYKVLGCVERVSHSINSHFEQTSANIDAMLNKIDQSIEFSQNNLVNYKKIINELNPVNVLKKGYSIIRGDTKIGGIIDIETGKEVIIAEVKDVRIKNNN